jgi:uncharacterized protein (UPF0332 family)
VENEKVDIAIRNAAEKAWNAMLQATNAILLAKGFEDKIRSHRERRLALDTIMLKHCKAR